MLADAGGKPGPERRSVVIVLLKEEAPKLGLTIPAWLDKFLDPLLGLIVEVVVAILNRLGFLEHSEEPLPGRPHLDRITKGILTEAEFQRSDREHQKAFILDH